MGSIGVHHVGWKRPGGRQLLDDVSFHVGEGERAGLVGANGVGKTTMVRLLAGDVGGHTGTIRVDGRLGVMRQLVGSIRDTTTVHQLLVSLAPPAVQAAAATLSAAEQRLADHADDPDAAIAYANALDHWGQAGGYGTEVFWDVCCTKAVGEGYERLRDRPMATFSGGQQKRLALEVLLRSDHDVLLLDEPDNFLDVEAKRWLEDELRRTDKTVLLVSHDRELLANATTKIVTIEGQGAWTHGGSFATYYEAREARRLQLDDDHARYERERERLVEIMKEMKRRAKISDGFAPKAKAAESRLRHFDEAGPPPVRIKEQAVTMRLAGARTGKKAVTIERLELVGLTDAFDAEIWFGERVAVLGGNGTGKSHFLRLLAGADVDHDGTVTLGANVRAGLFHQTHDHPDWAKRRLLDLLEERDVVRGPAMAILRRYGLDGCAEQWFSTLSGGQQARFQILLLELAGATLLLLDEPTDNLDLVSAEALEEALGSFEGTVIAVTHDRWFLRAFDRFLVFGDDCSVTDHLEAPARFR